MLIDEVTITIKAGDGGRGSVSLRRNAQTAHGGPDGGNGGNGGSVHIQGIDDIEALKEFQYKKKGSAENGVNGGKKNMYGRNGSDLTVKVPFGTSIIDLETNKEYEIDISRPHLLIAKGGKGGRGNNEFKSATNQTPLYAERGEKGEEKQLLLRLRLIADVGIIGLPNAGKSSLLQTLTNATPKIGNYPFTTLEPNLGVMLSDDSKKGIVLADIPGLIEGASRGKGLGIQFLKHIEKTQLLLHCIDATSENVEKAYLSVRSELETYSPEILQKTEIIVLTKIDLVSEEMLKMQIKIFKRINKKILLVSIHQQESCQTLKKKITDVINIK